MALMPKCMPVELTVGTHCEASAPVPVVPPQPRAIAQWKFMLPEKLRRVWPAGQEPLLLVPTGFTELTTADAGGFCPGRGDGLLPLTLVCGGACPGPWVGEPPGGKGDCPGGKGDCPGGKGEGPGGTTTDEVDVCRWSQGLVQ